MFGRKRKQGILKHTKHNRREVLASEKAGCVNCLAVFPPEEIQQWVEGESDHRHPDKDVDQTAICPHCGEAMIVGDHSGIRIAPAELDALRGHMRAG